MFECSICGLLSLNAISCPACGSQNLIDLSSSDSTAEDLPAVIPGLDEAAESWHEIEGSNDVDNGSKHVIAQNNSQESSLPFGFSGESNIQESRLPFGIGSHSDGIPFDNEVPPPGITLQEELNLASEQPRMNQLEDSNDSEISDGASDVYREPLLEVVVERPKPVRIEPIQEPKTAVIQPENDDLLPAEFESPTTISDEIPEEWRISVTEANMEEIYSMKQEVVEVVHQYEDDVVVFDHAAEQSVVIEPNFDIQESEILSLELHPARALDVDTSRNPECREDLDAGYFAIAKNSWAEAAIKFQKVAARMHGDPAVFNNYGLALLQRAIEMAKDRDESVQILAASQFESAILALREAAKSAPEEPVILLNLAHALLVSGRSEKAQKVISVHNKKYPNSVEGVNLEAAALVSLGQSVNAKAKLSGFRGDSVVDENLARLL